MFGTGSRPCEEGLAIRVMVVAHVGVVAVAEQAEDAFAGRVGGGRRGAGLRSSNSDVLAVGATERPVEVDAVGDGGHQRQAVARGPVAIDELGDCAVGVAAGVGRVVPRAVVVGGPVEELEVGVGAAEVEVEEVGQAHLADVELDAALGDSGGKGELGTVGVDEGSAEPEDLMELDLGDVGRGAEVGVADDIEVGEAGETECLGDAASTGGLDVEDDVGGGARAGTELVAEVEGAEE